MKTRILSGLFVRAVLTSAVLAVSPGILSPIRAQAVLVQPANVP
jgi:hypothetical protein